MKPRTCQRHFQCQGWPRLFPGRPSCTDAEAGHIGVGTVGVWLVHRVRVGSPVPCLWALPRRLFWIFRPPDTGVLRGEGQKPF